MWTYRIKYAKLGRIRFISHLDVMRAIIRAINRARIPVAYTEGFNPRPKLSMGPALPVGIESVCELADVFLAQMLSPDELCARLGTSMPRGLELIESAWVLETSLRLSDASQASYMIELHDRGLADSADELVRKFDAKDSVHVERVRKDMSALIDVRPLVVDTRVDTSEGVRRLRLTLSLGPHGSCSPVEAAQAVLNLSPDRAKCLRIVRTDIGFGDAPTPRKNP
ncbi:MAG: DUF2344 domain-containing protein [Candidatus Abyssobacteria bacterium SURF_17]|jgi:radical SAM-linked protein|uniref:DUF2344 domain-containing protein n=1 Tax=Candidatus Abyssobacteria bacterium SURF_17 TaxID=2093361 RepID=A0A419F3T0_9BACT|nr:MAG: DUF2344 domain-containing protein [Candidatus Abyssubacteria bacterium SURF_17]